MHPHDLPVFAGDRPVGRVAPDGSFRYDRDWLGAADAFPISTRLALREEPHPAGALEAWAEHLLPEGRRRKALAARLALLETDVLGMLAATGRDTVGALSFGEPAQADGRPVEVGSEADLERLIDMLAADPFPLGPDLAPVAGAQVKVAVALAEGRVALPAGAVPSTHILKPDHPHIDGSVQNEAFCLTLARLIGIPAARVEAGRAGRRSYLLVERFDRSIGHGAVLRRHQEDFCQASGLPSSAKYESNLRGPKGPSLRDMFGIAHAHMAPEAAAALFDQVVFNTICRNTDAHAKNYSLAISPAGIATTPLYDVLCAPVYDGVTRNMAQKIAGKSRGEHLRGRHWQREASACGLDPAEAPTRVRALCEAVLTQADAALREVEAMPAGGHPILARIAGVVRATANGLRRQTAETDPMFEAAAPPSP